MGDTTADDDYWWEQRLADASFALGQADAKQGLPQRSVHPSYVQGYNDPEGTGGADKEAGDKSAEASKRKTPLVVVRSWLQR